jgi:hypothetical protein
MLERVLTFAARILPYALLAAGVLSVVVFGLVGVGRGSLPWHLDLATFYGGGHLLLKGIVPYGPPNTLPEVAAEGVQVWIYA